MFRSLPSYGHLYPMMRLAEAARDAGHDAVFATAGDFVARLQSLGFSVVPAGVTMAQAIADRFGPSVPPTTVDGAALCLKASASDARPCRLHSLAAVA